MGTRCERNFTFENSSKLSISKKILLERYFSRLANQLKFFCLLSENKHVCYWVLLNKINLWPRRIFFGNTTTPKIRNILRKNRKHGKIHRNCFGKWYAVLTAWLKIFPAEDELFQQNCFFKIGKQSIHFCIFSNRTICLGSLNPVLKASANKFPRKDQNFSNKFWKFFYKVVFSPKKHRERSGQVKCSFDNSAKKFSKQGQNFSAKILKVFNKVVFSAKKNHRQCSGQVESRFDSLAKNALRRRERVSATSLKKSNRVFFSEESCRNYSGQVESSFEKPPKVLWVKLQKQTSNFESSLQSKYFLVTQNLIWTKLLI